MPKIEAYFFAASSSKHGEIAAYALARLRIAANGDDCTLAPTTHLVDEHSDGAYAVLRFSVAFGSGLVHGFGFASVLADLGLPQGTLALAPAGFNLGVEAGQLAIVTEFLPLAYALRRT